MRALRPDHTRPRREVRFGATPCTAQSSASSAALPFPTQLLNVVVSQGVALHLLPVFSLGDLAYSCGFKYCVLWLDNSVSAAHMDDG